MKNVKGKIVAIGIIALCISSFAFFVLPVSACTCTCTGCPNDEDETPMERAPETCTFYCSNLANCTGSTCAQRPADTSIDIEHQIGPAAIVTKLQNIAQQGVDYAAPSSPVLIAAQIIRAALVIIGLLFFCLLIYGGSIQLIAGGSDEKVSKAKSIILNSIIGLFIVVFAGAISQFVVARLALIRATENPEGTEAEYLDTSFFGGCPTGYAYVWGTPDGTRDSNGNEISGAACRRTTP